jgi:hypothetical protein
VPEVTEGAGFTTEAQRTPREKGIKIVREEMFGDTRAASSNARFRDYEAISTF